MAYNITTTAGVSLATIADGTVNSSATSLTLIGKNYAGYGNFLNENYLKLLENFAYVTNPANPLTGQLWYDTGNNVIKVYNGTSGWKTLASSVSQSAAPGNPQIGDMWWDTTNQQLKVWGGATWVTIGPTYTSVSGTSGAIVETIYDSGSNQHVVVKFYISNQVISILSSSAAFTPQTAIPGFAIIYPGMNVINKTALSGSQFTGDVSNALTLQGVSASGFIRSDQDGTTAYKLTAGGGLKVGSSLYVDITDSSQVKIQNIQNNTDLNLYVTKSSLLVPAISITGATANVSFSNNAFITGTLGVGASASVVGQLGVGGNLVAAGAVLPSTTNTINIGVSGNVFAGVYATNFYGTHQGNVVATTLTGTLQTASQPNITAVGTLANLNVTGNITTSAGYLVATSIAATIVTPVQNNITYVGTLGNLSVTGPVQVGQTLNTNGFLTGNVNGVVGGIYQASQYYQLQGNVAGANSSTAQSIFGVGVALAGSTIYEFEGVIALDKAAGTTPHNLGISFNGGTAVLNNIGYHITAYKSTTGYVNTVGSSSNVFSSYVQTVTNSQIFDGTNSAAVYVYATIKGTVNIGTGGTFVPQYTANATPGGAYTTRIGSYFKISPIGASGTNISRGTWA